MPERLEQRLAHPRRSIRRRSEIDSREPVIDPTDDIAIGQVAREQEEAVSGLI